MGLRQLQEGELISGEFVVKEKSLQEFRNKSGRYLSLVLADTDREIEARMWDNAESIAPKFRVGEVVFVKAKAEKYREKMQLIISSLEERPDSAAERFVPALEAAEVNRYAEEFKCFVTSVKDDYLRGLLEKIFGDKEVWQRFCCSTAAQKLHSAYTGGLLEHTVKVARLCEEVSKMYEEIHRDLLLTAALLHDIGKLDTFELRGGTFEYTDEGHLVGEPVLGERRITTAIKEIADFPKEYHLLLSHLLLSHHGEFEFGAPVLPSTLEAFVLHLVDNLEAKANGIISLMKKETEADKVWSEFSRALKRQIYLRRVSGAETTEGTAESGE